MTSSAYGRFAEVSVDEQDWSVTGGGAELGGQAAARPTTTKPTYAGASGNAC